MTFQPLIRPAALAEFEAAVAWYDAQEPGLGDRFARHVWEKIHDIASDPFRWPLEWDDVRERALLDYPYALYYRVRRDRIVVLAVHHASRDSTYLHSRK